MVHLEIKQLSPKDFSRGMNILDDELGDERVRSSDLFGTLIISHNNLS